ncbi:MAG: polyphosphate polymerase domain-containing protein [Saprospiraceae bacterium]
MRYERKYKIENLSYSLVEQSIRLHPAGFRKIFPDRQVNNIYFDTSDWTTFKENVMGIAERKKFRVRWYSENLQAIEKPVFEIKIKSNQLGDKISHPISPFQLSNLNFTLKEIQNLSEAKVPLFPTLLNSYHRSYFGTPDGKFRITLDRKLRYFSLLNNSKFNRYQIENEEVVMELKYDETLDLATDRITQHFPFRMTKSSKYVSGIELVNG